ncbi:MAG: lipid-binding SYLF domain-containing protein [Acidobacteriota bacterium]
MQRKGFYQLTLAAVLAGCIGAPTVFAGDETKEITERLNTAATVLNEVMSAPDKGIPEELLSKAQCVAVVPGLKKGAFIIGGEYGRGFMSCRKAGGWSGPASIRMEGGSVGFQIGASETDVVLLVMNDQGQSRLLSTQFTIGAEGEVAAGPVGRHTTAQTDAALTAEILSWSRSRGVFAGISLKGATLRQDLKSNGKIYGREISNKEIVDTMMPAPAAAANFSKSLAMYSPHEKH